MVDITQTGTAECEICQTKYDWYKTHNGVQFHNYFMRRDENEGDYVEYCTQCGAPLLGNVTYSPDVGLPKLRDGGGAFQSNEKKES